MKLEKYISFVLRSGAVGLLLIAGAAYVVSQVPTIICPVHDVPAQFTGRTQKDGEGRTIGCEYQHNSHSFWTRCQ